MNTQNKFSKSLIIVALATGLILLIPFAAMQYTDEVVWTLTDFVVAGTLLFGTGFTYLLVTRKSGNTIYRIAVGLALATGLLLIWVNLAVGIIGSENNPANLMYLGVLAVGTISALISRLRANGMAIALFVTALAQALVAVIALIAGMHKSPVSSVFEILSLNGFFTALWSGSALLFLYAARK